MCKNTNQIQDHEWHQLPNFTKAEFTCSCGCGQTKMDKTFMFSLQALRSKLNSPLTITSGYRCENHPAEAMKNSIGTHRMGIAVDIAVKLGREAFLIMQSAVGGFSGIGINRPSGKGGFIHLDTATAAHGKKRPNTWTY